MKIVRKLLSAFFLTLVCITNLKAGGSLPPPETNKAAADVPEPPADIDQGIMFLLVFALLFGIYTIYRYNLKRKASM